MCQREPTVGLSQRHEILTYLQRAQAFTNYLWFPKGPPTTYDRVQEANRRGVRTDGIVPWAERPKPDELADADVSYYDNPLQRLIQMHAGVNELTGFPWASPWYRSDALMRGLDC